MFETMLHAADPDHQRIQRLALAALIAVGSTSAVFASLWTLDRLKIDRIGGPASPDLELVQLSLLAPPPVVEPSPPPPDTSTSTAASAGPAAAVETLEESPDPLDSRFDTPVANDEIPDPVPGKPGILGIPGMFGSAACPGGVCVGPPGPGTGTGGGDCTGPACGASSGRRDPGPTQVAFSALNCLACPDPDQAELRRTASSLRKRDGAVVARFCVDTRGRVEADSVEITRSFGDSAVDRVARGAVLVWRFSPMKVAGVPRRACSEARFNIRFD
jgi:TonB family protein